MNLLIDVGNDKIKVYNNKLEKLANFTNKKNQAIITDLEKLVKQHDYNRVFISSVVPEVDELMKLFFDSYQIKTTFLIAKYYPGLLNFDAIDYVTMGSDRVCTTVGAAKIYGQNVIVFDVGTALTMDIVKDDKYYSGFIFPGLNILKFGLVHKASKLNDFEFQATSSDFRALNTVAQINDGLMYGLIGVINQYISLYESLADFKIILSGGVIMELKEKVGEARLRDLLNYEVIFEEELMQKSLRLIDEMIGDK